MIEKRHNIDLTPYNTFAIGVRCTNFYGFSTHDDLGVLLREGVFSSRWDVISGGSNILFTGDYEGTLLHPTGSAIEQTGHDGTTVHLRVGAGTVWDDLVTYCVDNGLWGAENLAYIPGYAGAAPVQNIGAYGAEAKDIIESVEMFCVDNGSRLVLANEHCGFGYRTSVFKKSLKGRVIITAVNFRLSTTPKPSLGYGDLRDTVQSMGGPDLRTIRNAVTAIRKSKLPEPADLGNAGSFFKNPEVEDKLAQTLKKEYPDMPLYPSGVEGHSKLAAGWMIDRCGWRGRSLGRAAVHEKQALVLVNLGGATGDDILRLAGAVTDDVRSRFGVTLQTEVNIL